MPIVVDASIAAAWAFVDEAHRPASIVLESLYQQEGVVPAIWWFEVRNALITSERRGRLTAAATTEFLDMLRRLPIAVDSSPDESACLSLARTHNLTVYDASYVELARRTGFALATLDRAMAAAARRESVRLSGGA
jgi:predicted nucleic acid-binding protein